MTQIESARKGTITPQMRTVAERENIDCAIIVDGLASGTIVIPANVNHRNLAPCGIGRGLSTKVNANIGTSSDYGDIASELTKLRVALEYKTDTMMDLSTGGDISVIRREILANCPAPLGTVPIYQAAIQAATQRGAIVNMTADDIFNVIEEQSRDGVDFITVHCGVTLSAIERLKRQTRVTDVVSRGGTFLIGWMLHN